MERGIGFCYDQKGGNHYPLQAEAETINWATQRALKLDVYYIIMESDAKVCVEAIHGELPF